MAESNDARPSGDIPDTISCDHCPAEAERVSEWSADDATRGWQRIDRYMCLNCGAMGVETVPRSDIEDETVQDTGNDTANDHNP